MRQNKFNVNSLFSKLTVVVFITSLVVALFFQNCSKYNSNGNSSSSSSSLNSDLIRAFSNARHTALADGQELISDPHFLSGVNAMYACLQPDTDPNCGQIGTYITKNPYYPTGPTSPWSLAQWGSLSSLPATSVLQGDHYTFADLNKSVKYFSDGRIELAINALNELGGHYFEFNSVRKWPHLLLQQSISEPGGPHADSGSLATLTELNFNLNVKLIYNNPNRTAGFNSAKHTSQFTVYFTVQNLNQADAGYGQYIWLGIPVYEERSAMPPANVMMDDGTKSLIYGISYSEFASESVQSGELVHMHANILPFAKDAVAQAARNGIIKSANLSNYKIGGTNLGFEITGLNTTTIQFSGFSLKSRSIASAPFEEPAPAPTPAPPPTPAPAPGPAPAPTFAPDTPEGFYRINNGDGIFYSNGVNAFCVFTSWATFVKWGGDKWPGGLGNRLTVPQNMRNDGACP